MTSNELDLEHVNKNLVSLCDSRLKQINELEISLNVKTRESSGYERLLDEAREKLDTAEKATQQQDRYVRSRVKEYCGDIKALKLKVSSLYDAIEALQEIIEHERSERKAAQRTITILGGGE